MTDALSSVVMVRFSRTGAVHGKLGAATSGPEIGGNRCYLERRPFIQRAVMPARRQLLADWQVRMQDMIFREGPIGSSTSAFAPAALW